MEMSKLSTRMTFALVAAVLLPMTLVGDDDLASRTLSVFRTKCSACHGSDLKEPESNFGHVDDLGLLARDAQHIVPGRPDDSVLFQKIAVKRDMPPRTSAKKLGIKPLTPEEIALVRAWISAGAPAGTLQAAKRP